MRGGSIGSAGGSRAHHRQDDWEILPVQLTECSQGQRIPVARSVTLGSERLTSEVRVHVADPVDLASNSIPNAQPFSLAIQRTGLKCEQRTSSVRAMHTFITAMESSGDGVTVAVKDLIDVAGVPTTAGSKAIASISGPKDIDAPLMAGARAAGARIVGKTNLYELAFGASGVNEHYGTPTNPLSSALIPGGSSSGSAVAVATGEAKVAYGSDSGGSIRVPAAFCGVAGLKTTHGRFSLAGVYPLAPSLDTVGPMATDVEGLILGMELLEPGFRIGEVAQSIGCLRNLGVVIDDHIARAIDEVYEVAELKRNDVDLPQWMDAYRAGSDILHVEAVQSNRHLLKNPACVEMLSKPLRERLEDGRAISLERYRDALSFRPRWQGVLDTLLAKFDVLVLPSVGIFAPPLEEAFDHIYTHLTMPLNLAGYPAVSIPVPIPGSMPASLQIVGASGDEERLLATALHFQFTIASI